LERPYPAAYARLRQAAAALAEGDPAGASRVAREALEITDRLSAAPLHDQLAKLAEGGPGGGRGPADGDEAEQGAAARARLTPRQLTVAQLVAQGKFHREIARELNIKQSTVARHVHDIYGALAPYGVDSKVTLANWIRDNGLLGTPQGGPEGGER
jgi:DNA-binding NarL/FixJ family response regulator